MYGYHDIAVDFLTDHPALITLALLVLAAFTVRLYIRTNPPLPVYLRAFLGFLRLAALLALAGALLEPVLHYTRDYTRPPRARVLIDHSTSMDREELGLTRRARLDSLRSGSSFARLNDSADLNLWYFGDAATQVAEQINADKTSLGEVIYEMSRSEVESPSDFWVLFSDGNSNSGRRPVEAAASAPVPVYAVDLAHDVGSFDVALKEIDFNPMMFVGQPNEIRVKLGWHGASDQEVVVRTVTADRNLSEKRLRMDQEDGFGDVSLDYIPDSPGQKLIKIHVPVLPNEESETNNERTVAVKVLKSRLSVLLTSGQPDYETGFLHRHLRQSERYEVDLIVTDPRAGNLSGRFPSAQVELNRYDLVILQDPDPRQLAAYRSQIRSFVSEKGGGLLVLLGRRYGSAGPVAWFNDLLPFYQSQDRSVEYVDFQGMPAEGQLFHPAVRLADDRGAIRKIWSELPPFASLVRCDSSNADGVVLAYASGPGLDGLEVPILGYRRLGPGKVMAVSALPLWPWKFVRLGFEVDASEYGKMIDGTISWLTVREDFDPIRIAPESAVFSRGEQVRFEGFAFDQGYRPIPAVNGAVSVAHETTGARFEADLQEISKGKYAAVFSQLAPGRYSYTAELRKGVQLLKRQEGEFLVEAYSLEEFSQAGDPTILRGIARESGGGYCHYEQFSELAAGLDLSPIIESETGEISFWGEYWLLLVFLVALALEWALRKLNHLI
ncbi:MAG: hypothetical protein JSU65_00040 [Candidatus Zixiibacteriota bacterium]|nr:MAG: hypothetical protein JSU65_00040 [candidate division Zixibacteria bacterium]